MRASTFFAILSLILLCYIGYVTVRATRKSVLQKYSLVFIASLTAWLLVQLVQTLMQYTFPPRVLEVLEWPKYIAVSLVSIFNLYISWSIAHEGSRIPRRMRLWLLTPIMTQVFLWTNGLHHRFFEHYVFNRTTFGPLSYVHAGVSYICLFFSLFLLAQYALTANNVARKKAIALAVGTLLPTLVNVTYSFRWLPIDGFATPIMFSVTACLYLTAVFRFRFLQDTPVVTRTLVDKIPYIFTVIDSDLNIVAFNKHMEQSFPLITFKEGLNVRTIMDVFPHAFAYNELFSGIEAVKQSGESLSKELTHVADGVSRYYETEFTPLAQNGEFQACIILAHDITEAKKTRATNIEQIRLASFAQMISSVAQNLHTPLTILDKTTGDLLQLLTEAESENKAGTLTREDANDFISEVRTSILQHRQSVKSISGVLEAMANQVTQETETEAEPGIFTVQKLIEQLDFAAINVFAQTRCVLKTVVRAAEGVEIRGSSTNLVQVLINIFTNSIQAYKNDGGIVYFTVTEDEKSIFLSTVDYAGGIPTEVQDKLFTQVIDSKEKNRSGLSLYLAHAVIISHFHGKMRFITKQGGSTEIVISLPKVV